MATTENCYLPGCHGVTDSVSNSVSHAVSNTTPTRPDPTRPALSPSRTPSEFTMDVGMWLLNAAGNPKGYRSVRNQKTARAGNKVRV